MPVKHIATPYAAAGPSDDYFASAETGSPRSYSNGGSRPATPSGRTPGTPKLDEISFSSAARVNKYGIGLGIGGLPSALKSSQLGRSSRESSGSFNSRRPSLRLDSLPGVMNAPKHTVDLDSPDSDSSVSPSDLIPTKLLSSLTFNPGKTARFHPTTQEASDEEDETPTVSSFALALKQARRVTPYPSNKDAYFESSFADDAEDSESEYEEEDEAEEASVEMAETSFRQAAKAEA